MPKWKELKKFCENDGWELYKDTDHYYFRKKYGDGTIRMTKVSKGSGEIKSGLWKVILKKTTEGYLIFYPDKYNLIR